MPGGNGRAVTKLCLDQLTSISCLRRLVLILEPCSRPQTISAVSRVTGESTRVSITPYRDWSLSTRKGNYPTAKFVTTRTACDSMVSCEPRLLLVSYLI